METFTKYYLNSAKYFKDTNRTPNNTEATYHRIIVFNKWGQLYDETKFFRTHFIDVKLDMNGRKRAS